MNVFSKILFGEAVEETRLGCPSSDYAALRRRMNRMATMTGMRGFHVPPEEPKVHPTFGTTRGQRKRARHAACVQAEADRQRKESDRMSDRARVARGYFDGQFGCLATQSQRRK